MCVFGAVSHIGFETMPSIVLENLSIDIPVFSTRSQSLRTVVMAKALAIGGNIIDSGTRISVVRALDQISFKLGDGDRLGLIGPNGAGKSTLIRVLADIYAPSAGKVERWSTLLSMFD